MRTIFFTALALTACHLTLDADALAVQTALETHVDTSSKELELGLSQHSSDAFDNQFAQVGQDVA